MRHRLLAIGLAAPLFLGLWLATPGSAGRPTCAYASGAHHVAVVVEHGSGAVLTACVAFDELQLTGDQVMMRSGIQYATTSFGGLGKAVCQIDGEPASFPPSCWTSTSPYWAMFVSHAGGSWSKSSSGISAACQPSTVECSLEFHDGDALGWHYVPQVGGGGGPPPSPAGVCSNAGPTPTPAVPAVTTQPAPAISTTPAPEAVAAASPQSPPLPTESPAGPVTSAAPSPQRGGATKVPAGTVLNLGWAAGALVLGGLVGLLILQLLLPHLRR